MKKILLTVLLLFLIASPCFSLDTVYERNKPYEVSGWAVYGSNDDIDTTAELMTELDTTYAQLAAADTLEVLSSDATDITQTITVTGINSSGKKCSEDFELTGTTEVSGTTTFSYVDQVSSDIPCAGTITVRRATGNTFITSIPAGYLEATMVQHFNGEYKTYVTGWCANVTSTTGTVIFELRFYPDDSKCLAPTTGYYVLDTIALTNVLDNTSVIFPQPILCSAGGWIAVYATGGANNSDGTVTLFGYDSYF